MPNPVESVTVSVGYADYLALSLEFNAHLFSKSVVVTDFNDHETPKVCARYPTVQCVKTDKFYREGASFCKSSGLNAGLDFLKPEGWVATWDADIALSQQIANVALSCLGTLHTSYIYGPLHKVHIQRNVLGSNLHMGGKACAGFFQLFYAPYLKLKGLSYPVVSGDCSYDDVLFSQRFNGVCYLPTAGFHLGPSMDDGIPNVNWKGRVSPPCPLTRDEVSKAIKQFEAGLFPA